MTKPYDEKAVLANYIWDHYRHLFSEQEVLAANWLFNRAKASFLTPDSSPWQEMERRRLETERLLDRKHREEAALDPQAFRARVCERIIHERANEVNLNRCPQCARIPRTPRAKQCPWCFHSWH